MKFHSVSFHFSKVEKSVGYMHFHIFKQDSSANFWYPTKNEFLFFDLIYFIISKITNVPALVYAQGAEKTALF